jgi:uncharacterized membrane protein
MDYGDCIYSFVFIMYIIEFPFTWRLLKSSLNLYTTSALIDPIVLMLTNDVCHYNSNNPLEIETPFSIDIHLIKIQVLLCHFILAQWSYSTRSSLLTPILLATNIKQMSPILLN